jgi:DNA recombination-dependent growth factor C
MNFTKENIMTEQTQNVVVEAQETEIQKAISQVKGFVVYTFETPEQATSVLDNLTEDVLLDKVFKPCGKYDQLKSGFTAFDGEGENFLLKVKGSTMFQVTTQEKRPHSATVKKLCKQAENKYQADNGIEKLDKETKDIIKIGVVESLIPTTEPEEPVTTLLWITGKYLVVGCATYKKSEDFVSTVRNVIGSCPAQPVEVSCDVQDKLTEMLSKKHDDTISLLNLVHLVNEESKGVVKFEKESLYDAEVKNHLDDGCKVSKIQLTKDYECDFTLNKDLEFSGVKVCKDILSGAKDLGALIITVDEINKVIGEIVKLFDKE